MKITKIVSLSILFGLFLILSINVYAQDPMKAAQNVYKKVLIDNEKVRVIEVEFAPGESTAWNFHATE